MFDKSLKYMSVGGSASDLAPQVETGLQRKRYRLPCNLNTIFKLTDREKCFLTRTISN